MMDGFHLSGAIDVEMNKSGKEKNRWTNGLIFKKKKRKVNMKMKML